MEQRGRKRIREFNPMALIEREERLPHGAPMTPGHNKLAAHPISKADKAMNSPSVNKIRFKGKYLDDVVETYSGDPTKLKQDIKSVWPHFEEELKVEMRKRYLKMNWKKRYITENRMWKRFIFMYTKSFQNVAKACDHCGISRNHYYRARENYPSFDLMLNIVDDRMMDEVEETTKKHSLLPNSIVERIFLLKTRRKEKYADQPQLVNAQKIEISIPNISAMRKEEDDKITVIDTNGLQSTPNSVQVPQSKE